MLALSWQFYFLEFDIKLELQWRDKGFVVNVGVNSALHSVAVWIFLVDFIQDRKEDVFATIHEGDDWQYNLNAFY